MSKARTITTGKKASSPRRWSLAVQTPFESLSRGLPGEELLVEALEFLPGELYREVGVIQQTLYLENIKERNAVRHEKDVTQRSTARSPRHLTRTNFKAPKSHPWGGHDMLAVLSREQRT